MEFFPTGTEDSGDEYTRTETIEAMRGEIFDRNGTPLVTNRYIYNITVDYGSFPASPDERNRALIDTVKALYDCGENSGIPSGYSPFTGVYPNIEYNESAKNPESAIYSKLQVYAKRNGLKTDDNGIPDCQTLVEFIINYYGLAHRERNSEGVKVFVPDYPESDISNLIRIYYNMNILDFGAYVNYTIAEDVSFESAEYMLECGIPGIILSKSYERVYNYPGYASHILGKIGHIYADSWEEYKGKGYGMNDLVGVSGCEYAFEDYLRGKNGKLAIVEDGDGNTVDKYVLEEAVDGKDVYLTIDINLQIAAEDGLAENADWILRNRLAEECNSGALVAMDPETFEVLAIASYPTYNLETYSQDYNALVADKYLPLYNRALDGLYAPGSTFKLGMAAIGLAEGTRLDDGTEFNRNTLLYCGGTYTYYKSYQPDCWIYNSTTSAVKMHGWINVVDALKVSCNCFFYDLGRQIGIETMNKYCKAFGLGQKTGIELSEKTGILAGPEYRVAAGIEDWQQTDTIAAAIGQSNNSFTPLQIATYVSTLLNGGTRRSVHLLSEVRQFDGNEVYSAGIGEIISQIDLGKENIDIIKEAMREMVEENANASYFMSGVPVTVGGKSGTAQTGAKDNALFVSAAPYNNPEIVVAAILEKGAGGSYVSYACGEVLEKYYKIKAENAG